MASDAQVLQIDDLGTPGKASKRIAVVVGGCIGLLVGATKDGSLASALLAAGVAVVLWRAVDATVKSVVDASDPFLPGWRWLSTLVEASLSVGAIVAVLIQQGLDGRSEPALAVVVLTVGALVIAVLRVRWAQAHQPSSQSSGLAES